MREFRFQFLSGPTLACGGLSVNGISNEGSLLMTDLDKSIQELKNNLDAAEAQCQLIRLKLRPLLEIKQGLIYGFKTGDRITYTRGRRRALGLVDRAARIRCGDGMDSWRVLRIRKDGSLGSAETVYSFQKPEKEEK